MGGKDHAFAQQFVVEHQQGAVEELKLVIPQNVEQLWFCLCRISNKPRVIFQHSEHLWPRVCIFPLISTQIKEIRTRIGKQLRHAQIITTYEINVYSC